MKTAKLLFGERGESSRKLAAAVNRSFGCSIDRRMRCWWLGDRRSLPRLVERCEGGSKFVKLGHVPNHRKTWEDFAGGPVRYIGCDNADDYNRRSPVDDVEGGPSAHSVDRNTVNEVGALVVNPCTDVPGEEAQVCGGNGWEAEPANLVGDFQEHAFGSKWERLRWEWEVGTVEENRGCVFVSVEKNGSFLVPHNYGLGDVVNAYGFFPVVSMLYYVRSGCDTGYRILLPV